MTCIVALCRGSDVWMAADSGGYDSDGTVTPTDTTKVWTWGDNDFVFGAATSFRANQILQHWLQASTVLSQWKTFSGSLEYFLVTVLLPELKDLLEQHGFSETENDQASMDAQFLIGVKGRIFLFQTDYAMLSVAAPFYAIGAGSLLALGALHVLHKTRKNPNSILKEALAAAETFHTNVRSPYVYASTHKDKNTEEEDAEEDSKDT